MSSVALLQSAVRRAQVLPSIVPTPPKPAASFLTPVEKVRIIKRYVARRFGVPQKAMSITTRGGSEVVMARKLAIHFALSFTRRTAAETARRFDTTRSTVETARDTVTARIASDQAFAAEVAAMTAELGEQLKPKGN